MKLGAKRFAKIRNFGFFKDLGFPTSVYLDSDKLSTNTSDLAD